MKIDCISDLHGSFPELYGGDLLIIAGDLTATHSIAEFVEFNEWLVGQDYRKKVLIGGNHDTFFAGSSSDYPINESFNSRRDIRYGCNSLIDPSVDYLCDSGTEFEGLKIWGSPWTLRFEGQNTHAMAFSVGFPFDLWDKFNRIPQDTDILVTHSPPEGILDSFKRVKRGGVPLLRRMVLDRDRLPNLKLHVFGHIHENAGQIHEENGVKFVSACIMNEVYIPVNNPVRIEL